MNWMVLSIVKRFKASKLLEPINTFSSKSLKRLSFLYLKFILRVDFSEDHTMECEF